MISLIMLTYKMAAFGDRPTCQNHLQYSVWPLLHGAPQHQGRNISQGMNPHQIMKQTVNQKNNPDY